MVPWEQNDELFIEQLQLGYRFQELVAERLRGEGVEVEVPELRIRPDVSQAREYADSGDLIARCGERELPIEVKSRNIAFTCPQDYPYHTAFVDDVPGWERGEPKTVVLVSQRTEGAVVVPLRSRPHWREEAVYDRLRRTWVPTYTVPRRYLLPFSALITHLKGPRYERPWSK